MATLHETSRHARPRSAEIPPASRSDFHPPRKLRLSVEDRPDGLKLADVPVSERRVISGSSSHTLPRIGTSGVEDVVKRLQEIVRLRH